MDKQRQLVVDKIANLERAILKTKSPYLRKDYGKAVRRLKSELKTYDRYKSSNNRHGEERWLKIE